MTIPATIGSFERTLVIFKPDSLERANVGRILNRFEEKGLKLIAMKMDRFTPELAKKHYSHLTDKPFFPGIEKYITRNPVILTILEGKDAVEVVRKMAGQTNAREAQAGTIRGDLAMSTQDNLIHASDSLETAEEEINRFFKEDEIFEWVSPVLNSLYAKDEL